MLNTTNYTRTLWNRDSYRIPTGSNLYGYVEHPVVIVRTPGHRLSATDIYLDLTPYTTTTAATTAPMLSSY
jgi:hypothetical protein